MACVYAVRSPCLCVLSGHQAVHDVRTVYNVGAPRQCMLSEHHVSVCCQIIMTVYAVRVSCHCMLSEHDVIAVRAWFHCRILGHHVSSCYQGIMSLYAVKLSCESNMPVLSELDNICCKSIMPKCRVRSLYAVRACQCMLSGLQGSVCCQGTKAVYAFRAWK